MVRDAVFVPSTARLCHPRETCHASRRLLEACSWGAVLDIADGVCRPPGRPHTGIAGGAFALGRIIVIPRAGLKDSAMGLGAGRSPRPAPGGSGLHIVEVPAGSERAAVERMSRHRHMKFADLDRRIAPDLITNDPYMGSAWHLPVISVPPWGSVAGARCHRRHPRLRRRQHAPRPGGAHRAGLELTATTPTRRTCTDTATGRRCGGGQQ